MYKDLTKLKEKNRRYYQKHREARRLLAREYSARNRKKLSEQQNKWNRENRLKVLIYYGGGELVCIRCGFNDLRALSLDHINGRGINSKIAKAKGIRVESSGSLYRRLIREGFPGGFQTLCMNCQWIKRAENKEYGGRKAMVR